VQLVDITAPAITLTQGAAYYAKMTLEGLESWASDDMVRGKLEGAGFAGVTVYDDAPAEVPDGTKAASGKTVWVRGTWVHPTVTEPIDTHFHTVWRVDADTADATSPPPKSLPQTAASASADATARLRDAVRPDEGRGNLWLLALAAWAFSRAAR
jgi:hypothetical protein